MAAQETLLPAQGVHARGLQQPPEVDEDAAADETQVATRAIWNPLRLLRRESNLGLHDVFDRLVEIRTNDGSIYEVCVALENTLRRPNRTRGGLEIPASKEKRK